MQQVSEIDPTVDQIVPAEWVYDPVEEVEGMTKEIVNQYDQALMLEGISELASKMTGKENGFDFTIESLNRLLARTEKTGFAVENYYGGTQQKKHALQMAIEDLGDTVREIVKATLRTLKRIYEVAFDFIEGMMRGANATMAAAEKLQDEAAKAISEHGENAVKGSLGDMSVTRVLMSESGNYSFAELIKKYQGLTTEMSAVFEGKSVVRSAEYIRTTLAKVVNKNKSGSYTKDDALKTTDEAIRHLLTTNFAAFNKGTDTDRILNLPFGGVEFRFTIGVEGDRFSQMTFSQRVSKKSPEESLPALTPKQVLQVGKTIESAMHSGVYRNYKQIKSALVALRNDIDSLCNQVSKQQRNQLPGNIPSLHFIKTITASQIELLVKTYRYIGTVSRALLAYGTRSLKKLGPAKNA